MNLGFTVRILREGDAFVAHVPELDVSTCGDTEAEARRNIADAVQGFLMTAKEQGTLNDILQEAGYRTLRIPESVYARVVTRFTKVA